MTYRHPLGFLLGLEGIALLRADAGDGFDAAYTEERITEIRAVLAAYDRGELGAGSTVGATDTVTGYRSWSEHYDEFNPLIAVEEPPVLALLDSLPAGRALDAACGTGRYSAYLAARGHQVVGVDSSPDMLAKARTKCPELVFHQADLTAVPLPDADVDLVVCALALPHVPELAPIMAEFARVLRPGGHLVISDIHWQSLYLGGVATAVDTDGQVNRMPASRFLPSDYLAAALPLGFQVRTLLEPRWPSTVISGGPTADKWAMAAVDAAYRNTPAAIIWHLQMA